jgi:hypothetical protein
MQDPSVCTRVLNSNSKDFCYTGIAEATGNVEVCRNIQKSSINEATCFGAVALKNKDIGVCEKITDKYLKESCLSHIG